jgi:hypothetical protein
MRQITGTINGNLELDEDAEILGMVNGNILVQSGHTVYLLGMCSGDIILVGRARAEISGMLSGEVIRRPQARRASPPISRQVRKQIKAAPRPAPAVSDAAPTSDYDVALSFAGEDRSIADALAEGLTAAGLKVFYDGYERADLWGKDLYQHLQRVYRDSARYCVVLLSRHYAAKLWPRHELRQAQERAFRESREYILPVRIDNTEIPGISSTTGYISISEVPVPAIVELLVQKLKRS